jgi:hypothetical protein
MQRTSRFLRTRRGASAVIAVGLLSAAVPAVALADGSSILGGARNPAGGTSQALGRETQIIADTPANSYGTRQSNKGTGGGAIYGCRSVFGANIFNPASSTPCIRVNNLSSGEAFQFTNHTGPVIGVFQAGNGTAPDSHVAPFYTNATAVAKGLNADRVDSMSAQDIVSTATAAAKAAITTPTSSPAGAYAEVLATPAGGQTVVDARSSGITNADVTNPATGVYCIKGMTQTPKNATATLDSTPGMVSVNLAGNDAKCATGTQTAVRTYDPAGALADTGFYIHATF